MKSNNKIADIELAIEKWKNSCDEIGENPIGVAIFTSSKSGESSGDMQCVLVGDEEDALCLLEQVIQATGGSVARKLGR